MSTFYKKYKKVYKKYILNNDFIFFNLVRFLAVIFYLYFKFVLLTSKIDYQVNPTYLEKFKNSNNIMAFWHGRLLSALMVRHYFTDAYVLISFSRGAYLVKLVCKFFKAKVIEGSSNRNGQDKGGRASVQKILQMLKIPKSGLAIAPDGSIGPRMRCSSGLPAIAKLAKLEVIPLSYSAKRILTINSWDKLIIPLPFNHITVQLEEPISFQKNNIPKTNEEFRLEIENKLNQMTWALDKKYHHAKIEPEDEGRRGIKVKVKNN